jgi:hypothetical protein
MRTFAYQQAPHRVVVPGALFESQSLPATWVVAPRPAHELRLRSSFISFINSALSMSRLSLHSPHLRSRQARLCIPCTLSRESKNIAASRSLPTSTLNPSGKSQFADSSKLGLSSRFAGFGCAIFLMRSSTPWLDTFFVVRRYAWIRNECNPCTESLESENAAAPVSFCTTDQNPSGMPPPTPPPACSKLGLNRMFFGFGVTSGPSVHGKAAL